MSLAIGHNNFGLSVAPQNQVEGTELDDPIVIGNLTVTSSDLSFTRILPVLPGTLTVLGQDFGFVIANSLKQLVSITDVSLWNVEITIFDSLSLITPEVGDIWWVPLTSDDGGTFTLSSNGSFEISSPTSGPDTLSGVLVYHLSDQTWFGPVDLTVINQPTSLVVLPTTQPTIVGSTIGLIKTFVIVPGTTVVLGRTIGLPLSTTPGTVVLAGQDITWRSDAIVLGELVASGRDIFKVKSLDIEVGTIPLVGQDIDLFSGTKLIVLPGTLVATGSASFLGMVRDPLSIALGILTGIDIVVLQVQPPAASVDSFNLVSRLNIQPNTYNIQSEPLIITGAGSTVLISITGDSSAQYQINGGAWRTVSSFVTVGDEVRVRLDAIIDFNQTTSCTLLIGTESSEYSVSTTSALSLTYNHRNLEVA